MQKISETYERLTRMQVYERQPYAGDLVFTAFSGSHQDAIAKGMTVERGRKERSLDRSVSADRSDRMWEDSYDADVIRINSQSGKGGVGLHSGAELWYSTFQKKMREASGLRLQRVYPTEQHKELTPEWDISRSFNDNYVNATEPYHAIDECHFKQH